VTTMPGPTGGTVPHTETRSTETRSTETRSTETRSTETRSRALPAASMYDRLGGMAFFEALTASFYAQVATDPVLRPLYPDDLEGARHRLCLFLAQFWGGPRDYEEDRGSPRLRARHLGFRIGTAERDRWLQHMSAAVEASGVGALERAQLLTYFQATASHMVNSQD